jgi:hypothetical protein
VREHFFSRFSEPELSALADLWERIAPCAVASGNGNAYGNGNGHVSGNGRVVAHPDGHVAHSNGHVC